MDAELVFNFVCIGLLAGCILACGIAAIVESITASGEYRARKRHTLRMRQIKRRAQIRRAYTEGR